jgi:hypothetical protein
MQILIFGVKLIYDERISLKQYTVDTVQQDRMVIPFTDWGLPIETRTVWKKWPDAARKENLIYPKKETNPLGLSCAKLISGWEWFA